jgi:hypothetical protein
MGCHKTQLYYEGVKCYVYLPKPNEIPLNRQFSLLEAREGPPLWSEFLATDPEARLRFPALPEKKVVGLERGPLSLVSTTEELLDRKVEVPV